MESQTPPPVPAETAPDSPQKNPMAITSLVLGILGLLLMCLSFVVSAIIPLAGLVCGGLGVLLGIAALISGVIAYDRAKAGGDQSNVMAMTGMITGGLQTLLVICILPVVVIAILTLMGPAIGEVFSSINASLK